MHLSGQNPYELVERFSDLPVIECGTVGGGSTSLQAVFGMSATESSFKSILGLGLLIFAHEKGLLRRGQTVIESTSGSLGTGLALAGQVMGNPIRLVTDRNIPAMTRRKIELLGATLDVVEEPDPVGGFQGARDRRLAEIMAAHPDYYWTDQNNSELNPAVYRRWVVPKLAERLDFDGISAGIFVVGSGGHFAALSELLRGHGIPSYVAERQGSITFGGCPAPSILRGTGNQNIIPAVIDAHRQHVSGVYEVSDAEAGAAVRELANRGIHVGGSSGVCFAGAGKLADERPMRKILTFFADRGELYGTQFLGKGGDHDCAGVREPARHRESLPS